MTDHPASADFAAHAPRVGVGVWITRADGRVLLVRRKNAHGEGTWSTPGGHLDFGEAPDVCAAREAEEETGVRIVGVTLRGLTNDLFPEHGLHYVTLWFDAQWDEASAAFVAAPDELDQVGWFDPAHLPEPLFTPLAQRLAGRWWTAAG